DLYFAASQSMELFPETRFSMYMQAIEAYHRFRYRNFEVDPEEHSKRLAIIISSIPEEYREWMRDGLEYSNEPSHGQRLREVYREFSEIMDGFVDDGKLFIFKLVKTRNHLTHLEGTFDDKVFSGNGLVLATTRLRLMLELCLLKEIGIGQEQMKAAVMKNTMFAKIKTSMPIIH
ncbi:MAG TPA: HEPN domain-containing protein, partial [Methanomassiliicoccales archaeon]|nr:HEPN domain-containing protein [Methanomassiliicoccales archaeon]